MAATLVERGVAPRDSVVLWCAWAAIPSVEALLAVLQCGAVLVPMSPTVTASEIAHVVADELHGSSRSVTAIVLPLSLPGPWWCIPRSWRMQLDDAQGHGPNCRGLSPVMTH